jgi:hypothetical protein
MLPFIIVFALLVTFLVMYALAVVIPAQGPIKTDPIKPHNQGEVESEHER